MLTHYEFYHNFDNSIYEGIVEFVNVNFSYNTHQFGWQWFVKNFLQNFHNSILYETLKKTKEKLIIDTSVEKTFLWNEDSKIYKEPWAGFVHHTFSDYSGENNLETLFKTYSFKESLKSCQYLYVFSEYLANKLRLRLDEVLGANHGIIVQVHNHPIGVPLNSFEISEDYTPKIYHLGSWLRNIWSFFELETSSSFFEKHIITNQKEQIKKIPENLLKGFSGTISNPGTPPEPSLCTIPGSISGTFGFPVLKGIFDYVVACLDSVNISQEKFVSPEDFEKIFEKNIIFVNYVDISTSNTLLEAVSHNTPILVNKHPAVVEVLGEDYPLYYSDPKNAIIELFGNYDEFTVKQILQNASTYIKEKVDKKRYDIISAISTF